MTKPILAGLLAALLAFGAVGAQPAPPASPSVPPAAAPQAHPLTREDAEAWLDGMIPYAMARGDIAGVVVVVVKDDQVLLQKGYGFADVAARKPVDPQTTLFRAGSISKLFPWTAVMQQVELGRLDLDKDINGYLDFRIAPYDGKPITLRNLMTHTSGFEEHVRYMSATTPAKLMSFDDFIRTQTPSRIFPPGQTPAYSNYGAGLAAYIVERVSHESFNAYVQRHIFDPLGMAHASFDQPLPARLAGDMSRGYQLGSGPAKPFELVNPPPAGALAISGGDAARFMLAHLDDGRLGAAQILTPQTATAMHTTLYQFAPPLNGMALGFFQEDRNGHRVIGHGGDLNYHHSDMHLLLDDHVGLFISMNSAGKGPTNEALRRDFLHGFMDRYFAAPPRDSEPTWKSAMADGRLIAGSYELSRRGETSLLAVQNLIAQATVLVDDKGLVAIPFLDATLGTPARKWREVRPYTWREEGGQGLLKAVVRDGKVVALFTDDIPQFAVLQPAPAALNQGLTAPLFAFTVLVLLLTALLWPLNALVRRHYKSPFRLAGRRALAYRASRLGAVANLASLACWIGLFVAANANALTVDASFDPWVRGAQLISLLGIIGAAAAVWNVIVVWTDRGPGWWARVSSVLLAAACAAAVWFTFVAHAMTWNLNF